MRLQLELFQSMGLDITRLENLINIIYGHMVFGSFLSNLDKNLYTSSGDH